jgi:hypothetical protein
MKEQEAIAKAMAALEAAEKQFTTYAEHHKLQANAAYATKIERERRLAQASTNYGYAVLCGDALEHLKLAVEVRER